MEDRNRINFLIECNSIPTRLKFESKLHGSLKPLIKNYPFKKLLSYLVSDVMSMSTFPVVISIKLSSFCQTEFMIN